MKSTYQKAFTMIELVFVIVVIGILSAIAIPKFAATRDDAVVARARATVAALRSGIATQRQKNILKGVFTDINGSVAESLLEYGLTSEWSRSTNRFTFTGPDGNTCIFDVNNSRFKKGTCGVSGMSDL
jgi:general secretion pathway protein G